MIGNLVEFEDLKGLTGYSRLADVERCLNGQGVRFFRGRDGVWTTMGLIEAAGGLRLIPEANNHYSPDIAAV